MNRIEENIQNLIDLWRLVGQVAGNHRITSNYEVSAVANSDWPNRIWFNNQVENATLKKIANRYHLRNFTIPVWGRGLAAKETVLKLQGFMSKSEQFGMSRPLKNIEAPQQRVKLVKVTDQPMACLWSMLFTRAFGYRIHQVTVEKTMAMVDYYVALHGAQPVGTAELFFNAKHKAGIHSMGIVPEMRRKGYARNLLLQLLWVAKTKGAHYALLQASASGKPLYEQVGFKEDFIIKNYIKH